MSDRGALEEHESANVQERSGETASDWNRINSRKTTHPALIPLIRSYPVRIGHTSQPPGIHRFWCITHLTGCSTCSYEFTEHQRTSRHLYQAIFYRVPSSVGAPCG